jgi:hypothetical protein
MLTVLIYQKHRNSSLVEKFIDVEIGAGFKRTGLIWTAEIANLMPLISQGR